MRLEKLIDKKGCGRPRSARMAANINWTGKLAAKQPWSKSCVFFWGGGCDRWCEGLVTQ